MVEGEVGRVICQGQDQAVRNSYDIFFIRYTNQEAFSQCFDMVYVMFPCPLQHSVKVSASMCAFEIDHDSFCRFAIEEFQWSQISSTLDTLPQVVDAMIFKYVSRTPLWCIAVE